MKTQTISRPAVVVEILGVAGAGKSTLVRTLAQNDAGLINQDLPDVRDPRMAPFFFWNLLKLTPILVKMMGASERMVSRRELAWMAMVNGWDRLLARQRIRGHQAILLDQGPIYLITDLHILGPRILQSEKIQPWWDAVYQRWRSAMNLVIWLDADDGVLAERICTRPDEHQVKGYSNREIFDFLALYRHWYDRVMARLSADNPRLVVLKIDTSQRDVDDISAEAALVIKHWWTSAMIEM